jgi:hypothetical protein
VWTLDCLRGTLRRRQPLVLAATLVWTALAAGSAGAAAWSITPTPNPPGAFASGLSGVSCLRSTACTAAGRSMTIIGTGATLIEDWNGTAWAIAPSPNPASAHSSSLADVSCRTARACTAVGSYVSFPSGTGLTLAERFDGTSWSIQPTPNPAGSSSSLLNGVSCPTRRTCVAVGETVAPAGPSLLIERFDGTTWSIQAAPSPAGAAFTQFSRIACRAADDCTAVGLYGTTTGQSALAERWNGRSWTVEPTPNPAGAKDSSLTGVSCPTRRTCTSVGFSSTSAGVVTPLAEMRSGHVWTIQPVPTAGSAATELDGVSCRSRRVCIAVGFGFGTLAEQWDGITWSIQPTPNPAMAANSLLSSVSCPTRRACVAVGYSSQHLESSTLAERYENP